MSILRHTLCLCINSSESGKSLPVAAHPIPDSPKKAYLMEATSRTRACTVALCLSDASQQAFWRPMLESCGWVSEWVVHPELNQVTRTASLIIADVRSSGAIELNAAITDQPLLVILNAGDPTPVLPSHAAVVRHWGEWDDVLRCKLSEAAASLLGESWIAAHARADQALLQSRSIEQELGRFSHDISNPLSIISGNVQLLLELSEELGLSEETRSYVEDIDVACRRVVDELQRVQKIRSSLRETRSQVNGSVG